MPDISLCANGDECPKRESCLRWKATPSQGMQSYAAFYKHGEECDAYWETSDPERDGAAQDIDDAVLARLGAIFEKIAREELSREVARRTTEELKDEGND